MNPLSVVQHLAASRHLLLAPETNWECPNCVEKEVTHEAQPHTRFHQCSGLKGLVAPFVPAGTKCKVVAHEREDYIGTGVDVTVDGDGRPIMAVETVRDDGDDVAVFAPCISSTEIAGA